MADNNGKRKKSKSEPFGKKLRTRKDTKKVQKKRSLLMLPQLPPSDDDTSSNDSGNVALNAKEEEDSPAYILIPIMGNDMLQDELPENGEISMEDAFDYPIGNGNKGRNRNRLKLTIPRKKSPLTLRLESARKEVEDYNKENGDGKKHTLKDQILLMNTDVPVKANILRKLEDYEKSKSGYDSSKYTTWVKDFLQLPLGKTVPVPISLEDGTSRIQKYVTEVRSCLDSAIAGQDHVKDEVIDFIARLISNPSSRGNILALVGPPGSGKTRLVRKGIAEALKRPFHVINLGGMNDVHVLTGHDLTYTGAKYGRLAQILIQSQCENPVVYLDEIDKVQSSHDKGMEIFRVLTHVLDEEQNHEFYDEYFSNVKINLSKILFVASLNNAENIEPILLDRLKLIKTADLDLATKMNIVRNYILPEICSEVAMAVDTLDISDEVITYVIQNKTEKEEGCRQLKRKWETIVQKLNTRRILSKEPFTSEKEKVTLTRSLVDDLLKNSDTSSNKVLEHMYS